MVAQRVAGVVLHVPDQYVVPVDQVERPIGRKLHIDRAEVAVFAHHQIGPVLAFVARSIIFQGVFFRAQKTNRVVDQEIALDIIRKMAAGNKLQARCWPHPVCFFNQLNRFVGGFAVARQHRTGHHPANIGAGGFGKKRLSPVVKRNTPGIWNGQLCRAFQLVELGRVAIEAAVGSPNGAIRRFDVGVQKHTFARINSARRIDRERVAVVVRIVVIVATQQNFAFVGFVVAVGIGVAVSGWCPARHKRLLSQFRSRAAGEDHRQKRFVYRLFRRCWCLPESGFCHWAWHHLVCSADNLA